MTDEYEAAPTVEEAFELHADEALEIANATFEVGAETWFGLASE